MRSAAAAASTLVCALVAGLLTVGTDGVALAASPKKAAEPAKQAPPEPPASPPEPLKFVEPTPLPSGRHAYELMRELRQLQDRVALGDADSILAQRGLIEKITEEFEKADDAVWADARNGRAVIAFVLSGGDVKVLRGLLLRGQPASVDANFGRAIHAFASNRRGEALDHFAAIDPLKLDPSISGQVALAQAELAARTDLDKALEKLDVARLLAPGTLIEEAAFRRQISILSGQKKFARADVMLEIYFRRFPRSGYGGALKRQIVRFMVERPPLNGEAGSALLVTALERLGKRDRQEMYVEMAKEAVGRSRRDIVEFAGEKALALFEDGSPGQYRAKIYLDAMRVASLEADKAKERLEGLKQNTQVKDELELIAAAQAIADEIFRVATVTPTDKPESNWRSELGATFTNVAKAHSRLAEADRLLTEASK